MDLAAGLGDSERHVGDETVEQIQNAQLADALSNRGRGAHVDEQQRALLDTRMVVASRGKGEERSGTQQLVDAEEQGGGDDKDEGKQEVDAADRHETTRQDRVRDAVDDDDDGSIKTRPQGEIGQKRQAREEPAGVPPQHEPIEREQGGADRSRDDRAGAGRTVTEIAVKRADQNANKDDPDKAPKGGWMRHRQRL